jgi:hypothetical protein
MNDRNVKQVPFGVGTSEGGVKGEGVCVGGWIWCKYFVYIYEDRTMEPIEIVLRKGGEEWEGLDLIRLHYMHIWKYHSEMPLCNQYMQIKLEQKSDQFAL